MRVRQILCYTLLLGTVMVVGACAAPSADAVAFTTIDSGTSSGIEEPLRKAINNQSDWESFWKEHTSNRIPPPLLPAVNFPGETIIVVFSGTKGTGGYSVKITHIEKKDGGLVVYYHETSPAPGQFVTEALTQPFHIVMVRGISGLAVSFTAE